MLPVPDELLLEILTRLPGKQLGRCKCVCKPWRSMIGSTPFLDAYRRRQPGLLLYFAEIGPTTREGDDHIDARLRFFYSTLGRKESQEEFSFLSELGTTDFYRQMTKVVNGLTCVRGNDRVWRLYNICTGQRMRLPDNPVCDHDHPYSIPIVHLGYHPGNRTYKLLRLTVGSYGFNRVLVRESYRLLGAEIMTLRPSSSLSSWKKLDYDGDFGVKIDFNISSAKTFLGDDGVLYWFRWPSLFSFDVKEEKFSWIKVPEDVIFHTYRWGWELTQSMGRLALWIPPGRADQFGPTVFIFYVLEDDEGNRWSRECIQLPEELDGFWAFCTVAKMNLPSGEMLLINPQNNIPTGEMLVMNPRSQGYYSHVYSYNHITKRLDRFLVGKLPNMPRHFPPVHHYTSSISYLMDNNNLHLPLDDVLSGGLHD